MQKTSPIRRYVLLRHGSLGATAPRWSKEPIGSAPRDAERASALAAARRALAARG